MSSYMKFISCEGVKELKLLVIFLKTIVLFSIFRRRFHNETIVFQNNENVNIPRYHWNLWFISRIGPTLNTPAQAV